MDNYVPGCFFMKHRVDMDDMVDMTCASCHRYQVTVHATMLYGCTSKQSETETNNTFYFVVSLLRKLILF